MANISFAPFCNFLIELSASESTVSEAMYDPFEGEHVLFERFSELLDEAEDPEVLVDNPDIELVPSFCIEEFRIGLL